MVAFLLVNTDMKINTTTNKLHVTEINVNVLSLLSYGLIYLIISFISFLFSIGMRGIDVRSEPSKNDFDEFKYSSTLFSKEIIVLSNSVSSYADLVIISFLSDFKTSSIL